MKLSGDEPIDTKLEIHAIRFGVRWSELLGQVINFHL